MADPEMEDAVFSELFDHFTKRQDGDVQLKAAQMIAIDMLRDTWKSLERYKQKMYTELKTNKQPGL